MYKKRCDKSRDDEDHKDTLIQTDTPKCTSGACQDGKPEENQSNGGTGTETGVETGTKS